MINTPVEYIKKGAYKAPFFMYSLKIQLKASLHSFSVISHEHSAVDLADNT
ncbi:MAG: hypothetical protein ACI89Z_001360 [Porticoccus sp.]|jgi:hypothetical protein